MCSIDWTATAAWVQAIGSVLAIIAAIWIGERQAKRTQAVYDRERKNADEAARKALQNDALLLASAAFDAESKARKVRSLIEGLSITSDEIVPTANVPHIRGFINAFRGHWDLESPTCMAALSRLEPELCQMGIGAVRAIRFYMAGLDNLSHFIATERIRGSQVGKSFDTAKRRTVTIEDRCRAFREAVQEHHGVRPGVADDEPGEDGK